MFSNEDPFSQWVLPSNNSSFSETATEDIFRISDSTTPSINVMLNNPNYSDFWEIVESAELRQGIFWSIVLAIAYVLILIIGILGNSLVIIVIFYTAHMRTVTNMFLVNLAVADLLVILFCVPVTLVANVFKPWILGWFVCKWFAYIQGVSVCASAYSLAVLSLDRCIAIYKPIKHKRSTSGLLTYIIIAIIWIISLLILLPWPFVFELTMSEADDQLYCVEAWKDEDLGKAYFLVANLICCYLLPLAIICMSNASVWYNVSRRDVPKDCLTIKRIHRKTRKGVRKTLSILTAAFLICWILLYAIAARVKLTSEENIGDWERSALHFLVPFAQWLGSLNSCLNPILYAFTNSKFRKGCKNIIKLVFPKCCSWGNARINSKVWKASIPQIPLLERSHNFEMFLIRKKCSSATSTMV